METYLRLDLLQRTTYLKFENYSSECEKYFLKYKFNTWKLSTLNASSEKIVSESVKKLLQTLKHIRLKFVDYKKIKIPDVLNV